MWVGLSEIRGLASLRWRGLAEVVSAAGVAGMLWTAVRARAAEGRRRRRVAEEFEAYAGLKLSAPQKGMQTLGRQVCDMVWEKSPFYRVALMVRDAEGCLSVVASTKMDSVSLQALNAWGETWRGEDALGMRVGRDSFAVVLRRRLSEIVCGRVVVVPLRTAAGRIVGVLAVGADAMLSVPQRMVAEAVQPLEALAVRLGRAMEDATLGERLQRAEKLAGLGLLAGGLARALNDPLTAVLGFAELIAETTDEARVRADAGMIVREALRMREMVDALLEFGRPADRLDEVVDVTGLLRELAEGCRETLGMRGVRLVVQAGEDAPVVRGSRERLRQVMEHLLNNAAQAVASAGMARGGEEHAIGLTVSREDRMVRLVVSDTGPGFREPGRAFDLFDATRRPGQGVGLGLSLCYGIVHEHGGEISAYNVAPHGAAVAVELPVGGDAGERAWAEQMVAGEGRLSRVGSGIGVERVDGVCETEEAGAGG